MGVDCEAIREVRAQVEDEVIARAKSEPQATTCPLRRVIVGYQWLVVIRSNKKFSEEEDGKGLSVLIFGEAFWPCTETSTGHLNQACNTNLNSSTPDMGT